MADEGNSIWYNLLVFLIIGLLCGLAITNAVIYNKIANNDQPHPVLSQSGARGLMWVNVVIGVITGLFAIYYLFQVLTTQAARAAAIKSAKDTASALYQRAQDFNLKEYGPKTGLFGQGGLVSGNRRQMTSMSPTSSYDQMSPRNPYDYAPNQNPFM